MIDLRSDTLSQPTPEMLETILTAPLGDDDRTHELGRGEDPTVNELENLAARITGKQAAVLFPSGTMANSAAVLAQAAPGSTLLVDELQHLMKSEPYLFDPAYGRMAARTYRHDEAGLPLLEDIERELAEQPIGLVCVENTLNFAGGAPIPAERLATVHELAQSAGVRVHMDGARIFNAAIALGVDVTELCRHSDTVMFCLSKGLSAPVGSLVCGDQEAILKVRRARKALGGAMRQAGIVAAPGIYALEHMVDRLAEDHENARICAEGIAGLEHTPIVGTVSTNIVVIDPKPLGVDAARYCELAAERGLAIKPVMGSLVRLVFYRGITRDDALEAVRIIRSLDESLGTDPKLS